MKVVHALPIALLVLGTSCAKLGVDRQAQKAMLADSIRFTKLTVAGNSVLFELARDGSGFSTRLTDVEPIDFPEYIAFVKDAAGKLTVVKSHTHLGINADLAQCTDSACTGIQMKLTRPGGSLGDVAMIKAVRVTALNCPITINETNGATTPLAPVFDTATVTTILSLDPISCTYVEGTGRGIYGKASYTDPETHYLTNVYLRTFVGAPSDLWLDGAQNAIGSDGRVSRVSTSVRSFNIDDLASDAKSITVYASDVAGRRANVGCTSGSSISVPAANPDPKLCVPKPSPSATPTG